MSLESRYRKDHKASCNESRAAQEILEEILAFLRALHWHYWTCHWQVKGQSFYGDHLLFERFYSGALITEIDTLAEKMVGLFGPAAVEPERSIGKTHELIREWCEEKCLHARSFRAEKELQQALKSAYENLKQMGHLSLGMDDFLMATASAHETNIYLLKQRLSTKQEKKLLVEEVILGDLYR